MPDDAAAVAAALRTRINPRKALILPRFFKTGPGQYGEGDRFLGVVVPDIRAVVGSHRNLSREGIAALLSSPFHEERMAALLYLVRRFARADAAERTEIYRFYLSHTARINNWDLVDLSCPRIVGAYLYGGDWSVLETLSSSASLWERRISIISTMHWIGRGDPVPALRISRLLVADPHDLIHKAVGWMLREVGKRCGTDRETPFLDEFGAVMPRTMLRYAIERFPDSLRRKYMCMRAAAAEPV